MKNRPLLPIFLLLAAQHIFFLALFPPFFEPDSAGYISAAARMLGGTFTSDTRLPGYPAFLAFFHLLFGNSYLPVIIFQHALGLLVWFIFAGMFETGRERNIFSALYFCDLLYNSYQHAILSDFLFSFLLCLSVWAARAYSRDGRRAWLLLCGLLVGLGIMTKPALQLFPYFILPAFPLCLRPWKRALASAAVFLAVPLLMVNLWCLRNYFAIGHYALMPMASYHFIGRVVNHVEFPENSISKKYILEQMPQGRARKDQKAGIVRTAEADMRRDGINTEALDAEFQQIFRLSILRHPFVYLKESGIELFYFFFSAHNLYAKKGLQDRLPVSVVSGLRSGNLSGALLKAAVSLHPFYWLLFALLAWFTMVNARRLAAERDLFMLYMYGLIAYIALVSSMANEGLARFRCEIQPLILFIATLALASLFPGRGKERRGP